MHVTLRARDALPSLRSARVFPFVQRSLAASHKDAFRVVHFSVQTDHVHLVVEGDEVRALVRGLQGLAARCAKAVNRAVRRRGSVWASRYHAHALRTPTEARRGSLRPNNFRKHSAQRRHRPTQLRPLGSRRGMKTQRMVRMCVLSVCLGLAAFVARPALASSTSAASRRRRRRRREGRGLQEGQRQAPRRGAEESVQLQVGQRRAHAGLRREGQEARRHARRREEAAPGRGCDELQVRGLGPHRHERQARAQQGALCQARRRHRQGARRQGYSAGARIISVGMGAEKPLVTPDNTEAKKKKNRRYEIQVR